MTFENQLIVLDNKLSRWELDHLNDCCRDASYSYDQTSDNNSIGRDCRFAAHLTEAEVLDLGLDRIVRHAFADTEYNVSIIEAYFNHYPLHAYVNRHVDDIDPDSATIIICCNKYWDESWGGELKIYEENGPVHKVVDYAPGRIIVFDSRIEHKAMPITPYAGSDRFTLAIKTELHGT